MRHLVLIVLVAGCAVPRATVTRPIDPLAPYAIAVEEAVDRYDQEVQVAVSRHAAPAEPYSMLLDESLEAHGLSRQAFDALAETQPRFYFTQQALYALRLQRLGEIARIATNP
jgi:hypothetical protein